MQQLPGRKDINSRNSVYEQSALDTFYGKTQEEAMELLLENFAHYSEHLGWMSSAGFAYYGQAWEKMLDCYDFEAADPEFTHEFTGYTRCIIVWRYGWWKNDPPECRKILRNMLSLSRFTGSSIKSCSMIGLSACCRGSLKGWFFLKGTILINTLFSY